MITNETFAGWGQYRRGGVIHAWFSTPKWDGVFRRRTFGSPCGATSFREDWHVDRDARRCAKCVDFMRKREAS